METLMDLTADYKALMEFAAGDDPEDDQAFIDTLEGILGAIDTKADGYAAVIETFQNHAERCKAEASRLTARQKKFENRIKAMKERLAQSMIETGRKEITTDYHTFKLCQNGGQLPIEYTGEIPQDYMRVVYEKDPDKIRAALESGKELPFAHFGERGRHVRIR